MAHGGGHAKPLRNASLHRWSGSNGNTAAEAITGWWRAGCGNLAGWGAQWGGSNNPGTGSGTAQNRVFANSLDEVAVYSGTALTAA
jgi:hypothetical protein